MNTIATYITATWDSLNIQHDCAEKWSRTITCKYNECHRFYHTLTHLMSMFALLDDYKDNCTNTSAISLAILFHDIIYDPTSKENEIESVKVFKDFCNDVQLNGVLENNVTDMILSTIDHNPLTLDPDLLLFLDLDLSILASTDYTTYSTNIRKEYSHVDESIYKSKRIQVLQHFIKREKLFFVLGGLEMNARLNIKQEIDNLGI